MHSCRSTTGKIVPLDGCASVAELRLLEDRLDEISRTSRMKAQRGVHNFLSAAEAVEKRTAPGSAAKDKLCALRRRIQQKEGDNSSAFCHTLQANPSSARSLPASAAAVRQRSPGGSGDSQLPELP